MWIEDSGGHLEVRFKTEVLHHNLFHLTVPVFGLVVRALLWASRGYCSSKPVSGWKHLFVGGGISSCSISL